MTNKNTPRILNELSVETDNWVVMGNNLLKGKSPLTSTQAKFLRTVIMQVKIDDSGISAYHVKAQKLADMLELNSDNSSRDIQKLCMDISEKCVKIATNNPKKPWKVIPWIGYIEYTEKAEVIIQLNAWLAPYLIGLRESGHYTQYVLERILSMNSIFSIRIYELLKMKLPNENIPMGGIVVRLTNEEIRQATETENKLKQNNDFKRKILEVATKEISEKSDMKVTYKQLKIHGRAFDTVDFTCKSIADNGTGLPVDVQCKSYLLKLNQHRQQIGKITLGMYSTIADGLKFSTLEEFKKYIDDYEKIIDAE